MSLFYTVYLQEAELFCDKAANFVLLAKIGINTKTVCIYIYDEYLKDIGGISHLAQFTGNLITIFSSCSESAFQ